jgi:hypothetical protein
MQLLGVLGKRVLAGLGLLVLLSPERIADFVTLPVERRRLLERFRLKPKEPEPSPEEQFLRRLEGAELTKEAKQRAKKILETRGLAEAQAYVSRVKAARLRI